MNPYLSIIIPAYNEEKRITNIFVALSNYFSDKSYDYEVIVVNDGSADRTVEIVSNYKERLPDLKIISYEINKGKGYAVKQGMMAANGQFILFADADNSTPIGEIEKLMTFANEGFQVIIGSRYLKDSNVEVKQSLARRLFSRLANLAIQVFAVWGIRDTQCGFKLFSNKAAKEIFQRQIINGWGFDFEILAIARSLGYKIKEVPVSWHHVGDSRVRPIRGALLTLKELVKIKWNLVAGKYGIRRVERK